MKDRSLAFFGISIFVALAFIGGFTLGARIAVRAEAQIAALQEPARPIENIDAVDEIKTLYQGISCLASWYGSESGTITANGERYDPLRFTAAHRTLPFDTFIIVENTKNGRLAIARVNDRGPNRRLHRREIDLSYGVARELGMVEQGLAFVRLWVIGPTAEMGIGRISKED